MHSCVGVEHTGHAVGPITLKAQQHKTTAIDTRHQRRHHIGWQLGWLGSRPGSHQPIALRHIGHSRQGHTAVVVGRKARTQGANVNWPLQLGGQ